MGHRPELHLFLRDPTRAATYGSLPCDGVGLLRLDEIILDEVRIHPLALLRRDDIQSAAAARLIDQMTDGHGTPADYFLDTVSPRLVGVAAAFAPRPVVVRFSDLTSDAYAHLIGGEQFEPTEVRPELGLRGAARYVSDRYRQAFDLECEAIKRARTGPDGHTNLETLIPFCRTVEEVDEVIAAMTRAGLHRGMPGLRIHGMAELPGNVVMVRELAQRFDGLSIGTDDLAQLVLGSAPADTALDPIDYNAEPVRRTLAQLLRAARDADVPTNLCGPGVLDPDLVQFAIAEGIDKITVPPEAFDAMRRTVAAAA